MTKQKAERIIYIIKSLPVSQSRFPKIEVIAEKLNLPKYKTTKLLNELVDLGMLSRTGNWYNFIQEEIIDSVQILSEAKDRIEHMPKEEFDKRLKELTDKQAKDYISEITESNKHELNIFDNEIAPTLADKIDDALLGNLTVIPIKQNSYTLLRWIMLFIGIISAGLLIYYISIYAKENLSDILAYIRSIVIVTFSFTSFQAIIILFRKTKSIIGYIGISLLFIFWLAVVIFSMISTIAGQFTLFSGKQENIVISSTEYNDTIAREKELINNRNILLNQINPYLLKLNTELDENKLSDIQYRITLYNKAMQKIDDELKGIRDKKVQLSTGKEIKQNNNFYDWLSKIIKWSSDSLQLFLYILPALFLDLIGPISFSMFLFLEKKKEE